MQDESTLPVEGQHGSELAETSTAAPVPEIAGFWIRVFSFLIDALVLGVAGMALGELMFDWLARLGGYERLIGFALVMGYAGVLNSRIGGGQTLGKFLLGARVVSTDGSLLSLPRSLARQAILAFPFFLNYLPVAPDSALVNSLLSLVVLGGFAATFYLLAFNRGTRQSLHDLAVSSYVTRVRHHGSAPLISRVWRPHLVIAGVLGLLCLGLPVAAERFAGRLGFGQSLSDMVVVQLELAKLPGVEAATIVDGATQQLGGARTTYVAVGLELTTPRLDDQQLAQQAIDLVRAKYPASAQRDGISVTMSYGFNMVIASSTRTQRFYSRK